MKTPIAPVALLALPLLLANCVVHPIDSGHWASGNGIAATETRILSSFSRVQVEGPFHVVVKVGSGHYAQVTSDENLAEYITTRTSMGTLFISLSAAVETVVEPVVVVTLPTLRGVHHHGTGLVEVDEGGNFSDLELDLHGIGQLRFFGVANRLNAYQDGSGSLFLDGYADILVADLRGWGNLRAENLLAGDADVVTSGSGHVYLDLDYGSVLNLTLGGLGNVEWWGAPAKLNYSLLGSGKVIEHRGLPKQTALPAPGAAKSGADGTANKYESVTQRSWTIKR